MTVHVLPSARDREAQANLEAFIARAKASRAFGDVDWDKPIWDDVALSKTKRATAGRLGGKGLFFLSGKGGERGSDDIQPLRPPFVDFLKALVRRQEERVPRFVDNHRVTIRACRYLHDALELDGYDPCRLTNAHFDRAANAALAAELASTAYATGKALVEVARSLDEYAIARVRLGWKNKVQRPSTDDRHGPEAEERRVAKMPSEAALDALPKIANMELDDPDLLRTRTIELLACGGWRINELLSLPENCEVEETATERGKPKVDAEGNPVVRYGIRYFAEKGFGPAIKWMPTPMVDVARRAIADIRRVTAPVRADAHWMVEHAGRVNLPGLDSGDPEELVAAVDVARALGIVNGVQWCDGHGVPTVKDADSYRVLATRADVCRAILGEVPSVPESYPVRLEDHLFLVRDNFFHRQRGVINASVRLVIDQMIGDFITGGDGRQSVFERHGFTEPDGSPIRVTTHQLRHWLNTLAQEGGMSQELIARWSGRKDMSQNAAYDHVSGRALARKVRALVDRGLMKGPIADVANKLPPADREAFLGAEIASAHVTEIGLCVHDWSLAPCPSHGDCANCNEHVVDKGNAAQRTEAERQLAEAEHMLAIAERERADGTHGAARWVDAHRRRRDGIQAALDVHRDAAIAEGTLVHVKRGPAIAAAPGREAAARQRKGSGERTHGARGGRSAAGEEAGRGSAIHF